MINSEISRLLNCFPHSFINHNSEFIAHEYANVYFRLEDVHSKIDLDCKVLEWLSRPIVKGAPYNKHRKNKKFRKFIKTGANHFLNTNFTNSDFKLIYQTLGQASNQNLTKEFIRSKYNIALLTTDTTKRGGH